MTLKKLILTIIPLFLLHSVIQAQGSLEVTSERKNFGIDKINVELNFRNADLDEPLRNVTLTLLDSLGNQMYQESNLSGQKKLNLDINQLYTFTVTDPEFEDTTFVLDAVNERKVNQSLNILLNPKKIIAQYNITDFDTGDPLDESTKIILINKNRDERIEFDVENKDGSFIVELYATDTYELTVTDDGYFFSTQEVKPEGKDIEPKEVRMVSLTVGNKIAMENITFEPSSAILNDQVKQELERVVDLMNDNPTLYLKVTGHTDNYGSEAENLSLSQKRVDSVIGYLTSRDIPIDRLQGEGVGESQPLFTNDTAENRAKNRRFELIVLQI